LDRSALAFAAALPIGLAIGSAAWLAAAPPLGLDVLTMQGGKLAAIGPRRLVRDNQPDGSVAQALAAPLFVVTTGPGAVADIAVKLEGLVRSPGRVAALLSINGGASEWLELGQTHQGVTLQEVAASKVVVDTAVGLKDVLLGEAPSAPEPVTGGPPPGFRSPPPPASAPGAPK
jgi:hypothetical protein